MRVLAEPSLKDLLEQIKRELMLSLNCHGIGIVQEFDAEKQTIKATMAYKKKVQKRLDDGKYKNELMDYPILLDCPAVVLGGGASRLTFPIVPGDECVLLFNDRALDGWFTSGQVQGIESLRLHAFADAIALVGVRSIPKALVDYDMDRAVLAHNGAMVGVGYQDMVKIANAQHTLKDLLVDLIGAVNDLVSETAAITVTGVTSGGAASGPPANAATITAIATDLSTLSTEIGELLE